MNKLFVILITFFLSYGCSYKPILSVKEYDFKFTNIYFDEKSKINNLIRNKLIKNSKKSSEEEYDLSFSTIKNKEVVSSNKKGDPTIFKIEILLNYSLKRDGEIILNDKIRKQLTYNNINDKFELLKYEENVLNDILENIISEVLMSVTYFNK